MLGLKPMELLLILFVLLLLFGATRLPQLGSSLGSAIRNFKRGFGGEEETGTPGADKKGTGTLAGGGNVDKDVKSTTPSSHA
ncbi:twin-arginine translocase TatA/TatE family subunit [Myxococcus sp. CA051A]|uniref:twin-arginine translocase TatA/TatE family subunit n=2 Tax=Myxococcaceae TaxID=31 RepID=UPI00157A5369|nr:MULTISPECIES: twin-arginine translocase TatA/TatE family subunit [Myxococcus]NTX03674.1 twin-arginine translocase TatA/TatE family subunit [Myxococcus sp. CA040A]NTX14162.1 twin-arginine translocase TatA/TatE family subunit [Myxococcus sp. CA056]NTX35452.1 twin-arginine translocase TatA/TatE family subunit [Myxococcus sp. CA033]NTX52752.1 twin-arginine translocase TatA/TatE family subunit [Myxococcus sp. CA039A]NTX62144.1 twin-arginine translocase TatA/TatE family subunit [Myxococcus sp. CA